MRIIRVLAVLAVAVSFAFTTQGCHEFQRPNIILIVGDDLGYADISAHGIPEGQDIGTPNIDRIAAGGAMFTNGYVSCPVCSPTRAGFLTGRYQQRFQHENNPPSVASQPGWGLSLQESLISEQLKALGYTTGIFGKWHQSNGQTSHPLDRGFDEFYGFLGGAHDYFNPLPASANPILDGRTPVTSMSYLTYEIWGRALDFLDRNAGQAPVFLYLPFNACHTPLQAPQEYLDLFPGLTGNRRTYAAMMRCMDDAIGAVLDKVAELGLERNTIVYFISDNGGPTTTGGINGSRNNPLRGSKTQTFEGGIRVPFFMKWPAHIPAGTVVDHPVISLDILPTSVAAAGGQLPADGPYDGVDLFPFVTGADPNPPHDQLFWRYQSNIAASAQRAMRWSDWKIVKQGTAAWQLYFLAGDIGETTNLASTFPEFTAEMAAMFVSFAQANFLAPGW